MKRILLLAVMLLFSFASCFPQKHDYKFYGFANNGTNWQFAIFNSDLSFKNIGNNKFSITKFNPYGKQDFKAILKYYQYSKQIDRYTYVGTIETKLGTNKCIVETGQNLSNFTVGYSLVTSDLMILKIKEKFILNFYCKSGPNGLIKEVDNFRILPLIFKEKEIDKSNYRKENIKSDISKYKKTNSKATKNSILEFKFYKDTLKFKDHWQRFINHNGISIELPDYFKEGGFTHSDIYYFVNDSNSLNVAIESYGAQSEDTEDESDFVTSEYKTLDKHIVMKAKTDASGDVVTLIKKFNYNNWEYVLHIMYEAKENTVLNNVSERIMESFKPF